MPIQAFDSLDDVIRSTFPARFCRILAKRVKGDAAYVLFDTGPEGQPYFYGVNYERTKGRWCEASSSNGGGWSLVGPTPHLGTLAAWGEAPAGADRVRVEFRGESHEEPVANGVYLAVWWQVPCPEAENPWLCAFRINGEWVAAT